MVAAAAGLRSIVAEVQDPEMPALTIEDLGILRDVRVDSDGRVEVDITPTYSGCPALEVIRDRVAERLRAHGHPDVTVNVVLGPAWTTDWMTENGRRSLRDHGVAPPRAPALRMLPQSEAARVRCPACDSDGTAEVSRFGSTPCQSLWRCSACGEPFQHFKEH